MNNIESTIVSRTPVAVETGTRSLAQGNFLDENSRKNINVIEQTCDSDSQTYRWQSLFFLTNNFIHRELPDDAKTIFIYVAMARYENYSSSYCCTFIERNLANVSVK